MSDFVQRPTAEYWLLVKASSGATFTPSDVILTRSNVPTGRGMVLTLFTSRDLADMYAADTSQRGDPARICTVRTADEMTDLLSRLRDGGVTHVITNPLGTPADDAYIPIERAILSFQVLG